MSTRWHVTLHIALGAGLIVCALAALYQYHVHSLDLAKVEGNVAGRAQQQKEDDKELQNIKGERDAANQRADESDARYAAQKRALPHLTPQQIVSEAPQFISGLPRPITVWDGVTAPVKGDVIVPQEDVHPIAQNVLDGNHCVKDQLPQCVTLLNLANRETKVWSHKFDLKDMDSKDWEKVAKQGGWTTKLKRCGTIGAVNFGVGYGLSQPTPQSNNRLRDGAILGGGNALLCWMLK